MPNPWPRNRNIFAKISLLLDRTDHDVIFGYKHSEKTRMTPPRPHIAIHHYNDKRTVLNVGLHSHNPTPKQQIIHYVLDTIFTPPYTALQPTPLRIFSSPPSPHSLFSFSPPLSENELRENDPPLLPPPFFRSKFLASLSSNSGPPQSHPTAIRREARIT